ncbi:MAG: four helix bundle protein [Patescibacteria group bacterium]
MKYENSFRKLVVWQNAKKLIALIYKLTKKFPREEMFGLTSQLRRAAVSVAANIAEGSARIGKKEKRQFYIFAKSSLVEVDCFSELSFDQSYLTKEDYKELLNLINTTAYLLVKLISAIKI